MHAALIVNKVGLNCQKNLVHILDLVERAVVCGADLILLPETALTGLINNDNPTHDLALGEQIPGPVTSTLCSICQKHSIWLGIGFLERKGGHLYDTAVLIDGEGHIKLKYRRIQSQWHGKSVDPTIYIQGIKLLKAATPFGSLAFLICGDLFDDEIVNQFMTLKVDIMLYPFARCFSDGSMDQNRWDTEELPEYITRVQLTRTPTLMVNYLADSSLGDGNSFGGAYAISASGEIIGSYPLGKPGILLVDLNQLHCM